MVTQEHSTDLLAFDIFHEHFCPILLPSTFF